MKVDQLAQSPLDRLTAALKAPALPKDERDEGPAPDSVEALTTAKLAVREFMRLREARPTWFAADGQRHVNNLVNEILLSRHIAPGARDLVAGMVAAGIHAEVSRLSGDIDPARRAAYEAAVMEYATKEQDRLPAPGDHVPGKASATKPGRA